MSDHGYDYILEAIKNMTVKPPSAEDYNLLEFDAWKEGFKACYNQITELIMEIKEANCQRR